jgi:hypothetical protein
MIAFEARPARVPDQLAPLMDDHFMETQERWQNAAFDEVLPDVPRLMPVDIGNERVLISRLAPQGEHDGTTVALAFPFLQGLNKTMMLRSAFMQQAVMPQSEVLLLPNIHTGRDATYIFSDDEKKRLSEGSLDPLAEKYVRVFETLKVGNIALTGYSKGARVAVDIAAVGSPAVEITHVNADEAPSSTLRGAKQLQKDFIASGALKLQRKSMSEAGFGSLLEREAGIRLPLLDYSAFGIKSLGKVSKLIHTGMTDDVAWSIYRAYDANKATHIKFGAVEGSALTDLDYITTLTRQHNNIRTVLYTGDAANKHTTGDNYAAHALMVKDGFSS